MKFTNTAGSWLLGADENGKTGIDKIGDFIEDVWPWGADSDPRRGPHIQLPPGGQRLWIRLRCHRWRGAGEAG